MATQGDTITYSQHLVVEVCCNCEITFAMPTDMRARRLADKATFYCPAGHPQHFVGETEEAKLRRQLGYATSARDAARDQAEMAERRRRAAKGQLTKVKNRVARGVCPCCNRSFVDLGRHMAGQHPDFAP